ncbi:D-isomer specific 2-hydroxyacid dehydrogenase [Stachybotrys elegans]|uniref:D-isomer specific 2-hydroxyacid dehydrogenase n=1 Tax=Stachybotrys elegans TaxID=80388 RepID=A0A8K0SZ19_9HYPO|nr:D-isomer specific 2-hydroxyacid dehydrogenase [Stachybotrys elegans]
MAPALSSGHDQGTAPRSKPTVYLLDNFHPDAMAFCEANFNPITRDNNPDQLATWRVNAQYILIQGSRVTAEDIAAAPHLKAIGKQGVGIDKIDAAACRARNIPILNTPGINAQAVAELVLALALGVARQLGPVFAKQAHGIIVPKEKCTGFELRGKTIGILGMGKIGCAVSKIFGAGFDCPIIAYDPYVPAGAWSNITHERASTLDEVWAKADIITVHMPLTPETRDMISYEQMKAMKPSTILINAARGGIINEQDLECAISQKLILGAGLDCHEEEPPSKEKYGAMWDLGVVSTPHLGGTTADSQRAAGLKAAENLLNFIQNDATALAQSRARH